MIHEPVCFLYLRMFGSLNLILYDMILQSNLRPGNLLRFAVRDESVKLVDGKMQIGQLQFVGKPNRARAFACGHSKALFQHVARNVPLRIEDLVVSIQACSMKLNPRTLKCKIKVGGYI